MKTSIALLTIAFACAASLAAEDVDYVRQVKPVLRERCFACHGALKQQAGLRLDTAAAMQTGGESGAALVPRDAKGSLLVERITSTDASFRMPPEGKPLTEEQIAAIAAWIDQGAAAPAEERPDDDPLAHWAFQAPIRPAIPTGSGETNLANPIDAFLAAERSARNLVCVPPADRGLLLRRVYLDLIGLPPTQAELQAFLADERPDAYERVVERLLASPHYGERWGRHWLDIWRYSDWFGLGVELRNSQKHIWHWRDWTIESLNADRGYDRMVREMLAADEIAPTDRDALRATGFLARNYFLFNRTTWLDDTIEHTSKAFLGLTLNCAKCHDHKYDPLTHVDYYRMRAVFEPHQVRLDPLPGETDLERDGLPRVFDAHADTPTYVHLRGDEKRPDKEHPIPPGPPAFLTDEHFAAAPMTLPAEAYNPSLQQFVLEDQLRAAQRSIVAARASLAKSQQELAAIEQKTIAAATSSSDPAPAAGNVFLHDEFAASNEAIWETGPGEWKYADGRLMQLRLGAERAYLRSRGNHPADFEAVFRFKTLGGEMWKSVGLSFDVTSDREKLVYLSAVNPGAKLQISYNPGSGHVYPPVQAGALTLLPKPVSPAAQDFDALTRQFVGTVRAMADVKVVRRFRSNNSVIPARGSNGATRELPTRARPRVRVIAIAASTGGPAALQRVLSDMPASLPVPVLVVQHIARGFVHGLASWLTAVTPFQVKVAEHGEVPLPGRVYIAPDDHHLAVTHGGAVDLTRTAAVGGFVPSASVLFASLAESHGASTLGLIMTGMGQDGVDGLRELHRAGATVLAQDEETSVVFGMPGAAVDAGLADAVLPLPAIGGRLFQLVRAE